jgi:hypothetical protein
MLCQMEEFMDIASHLCTLVSFLAVCLLVPGTAVLCTGKQTRLDRNDVVPNRWNSFTISRSIINWRLTAQNSQGTVNKMMGA